MTPVGRYIFAAVVSAASIAASSGAHAAAESQSGPQGRLIELMPAEPGRRACFTRSYDTAHLRAHPKQRLSAATFLLRVVRYNPKGERLLTPEMGPDDWTEYQFAMEVKRRGRKGVLRAGGYCYGDDIATCVVDCDGGGVTLKKATEPGSLMVRFLDQGIRMHGSCDDETTVWVRPGSDDKTFRLDRASAEACKALENNELSQ